MWQIAFTLTGDEATAAEVVQQVVKQVVAGTLPQPHRSRQGGMRLEVVIAAIDAAAARVFSPLDRRVRPRAYAAAHSLQASALQRAFSRRVSWDVQVLLWATEVEKIAESDVTRRLGEIRPGRAAGRAALRLAYLDLRWDLDDNCKEALRNFFRLSADLELQGEDSGLALYSPCHAEARWLSDLRLALLSLAPPVPPDVWWEARQLALGDTRQEPDGSACSDGSTQPGDAISAQAWPSPRDSRSTNVVVVSAADEAKASAGGAATATQCPGPALAHPAVEPQNAEAKDVTLQKVEARKLVDRVVFR